MLSDCSENCFLARTLCFRRSDDQAGSLIITALRHQASCCVSAGSDPLRSLIDRLLEELGGLNHDRRRGWQCEAAAIVTVLSELCFGASQAWQPQTWASLDSPRQHSSEKLQSLVSDIQEHFLEEGLWDLQTSNDPMGQLVGSEVLKPQARRAPFLCHPPSVSTCPSRKAIQHATTIQTHMLKLPERSQPSSRSIFGREGGP